MAVKYRIEYYDVRNIQNKAEIEDDNYVGSVIDISGTIELSYNSVERALDCVRGQGLRVNLDADVDMTFEDLFSEDEKTFKITYWQDNQLIFIGWLNSEGWYEDWVQDKWVVSFDAIDGLGYLKDLSFVDDAGEKIVGKQTMLYCLQTALKRTGLSQFLNVDIDIYYEGSNDGFGILEQVYVQAERYIKSDQQTILDCYSVVTDILEPFGAVIMSNQGQWWVYRPNKLFDNQTANFRAYSPAGVDYGVIDINLLKPLGSQINSFYPHHCNENQSISNKSSLGALRIYYKYGLLESLNQNPDFLSNGSGYDFWTINSTNNMIIAPAGESWVRFVRVTQAASVLNMTSQIATVIAGSKLRYSFQNDVVNQVSLKRMLVDIRIQAKLVSGPNTYYYNQNDEVWELNGTTNFLTSTIQGVATTTSFDLAPTPMDGDVTILIWTPVANTYFAQFYFEVEFTAARMTLLANDTLQPIGETHDFQRISKPTAKVDVTKDVFTGDSNIQIYTGTLYKSDADTPTEFWHRKGVAESKPILQIMGEETMKMRASTQRIFSGDIYGYIPYRSVVQISNITGLFMFKEYRYNSQQNILSASLIQIYNSDIASDLYIPQPTQVYNNETIKPTIKG